MITTLVLPDNWLYGLVVGILLVLASIISQKITIRGALLGGLIGMACFLGANFTGMALLIGFFVMGTMASQHKKKHKITLNLAQENAGKRGVEHVIANGGVAGVCALLAYLFPAYNIPFSAMLSAALSAAAADTWASELGNVYGKKYYNIITWQADERGKDGVVSAEGTLLGVLASVVIAMLYASYTADYYVLTGVVIAGIVGNITDSVLGATLQQKGVLSNSGVNFVNTLAAALFMLLWMGNYFLS